MVSVEHYLVTDLAGLPHIQAQLLPLENVILRNFENRRDVQAIHEAITFAAIRHNGQLRNSGDPQMVHPLGAMTYAATYLGASPNIVKVLQVIALHDVIEDTSTRREEIADKFGEDIALAVDILSKKRNHITKEEYEGETDAYFKDLLALENNATIPDTMRELIRELVCSAKVADRMENIITLDTLVKPGSLESSAAKTKKRDYIAETRDYIIPLLPRHNPLRSALERETAMQEALLAA